MIDSITGVLNAARSLSYSKIQHEPGGDRLHERGDRDQGVRALSSAATRAVAKCCSNTRAVIALAEGLPRPRVNSGSGSQRRQEFGERSVP